jgi:hypothetical protein
MKIILGDNQFFGINHHDLNKANKDKSKFADEKSIVNFIISSLNAGLDGFMINSNQMGYNIINEYKFDSEKEIHYSIPYPHKYAAIINANGMSNMLSYFIKNTSLYKVLLSLPKYLLTQNLKYLIPIATSLEIPKSLPIGSTVYLQNVVTDLILGLDKIDILEYYANDLRKNGYKVGIITLNPLKLDKLIKNSNYLNRPDVTVCFNINLSGFNVFPSKQDVEKLILTNKNYNLMGMSIFSSGGAKIEDSIDYIKGLNLSHVVFGSSNIENVKNNFNNLTRSI